MRTLSAETSVVSPVCAHDCTNQLVSENPVLVDGPSVTGYQSSMNLGLLGTKGFKSRHFSSMITSCYPTQIAGLGLSGI
jgi:hypothetical protein